MLPPSSFSITWWLVYTNCGPMMSPGPFHQGVPYTARDLKAVEELKTHSTPTGYKPTKASKAAYELLGADLRWKDQSNGT